MSKPPPRKQICADNTSLVCPLFQAEYGGSNPTSALQLRVYKVSRDLFKELNRRWHSRLPKCGNCFMGICYAAVFNNKYFAVAWWSHPVSRVLAEDNRTWELRRMAVSDEAPKNTASRFLSIMVMLLQKERPELERLISYQDTAVHKGTIYKASGWIAARVSKGHSWTWNRKDGRKGRLREKDQSTSDKICWQLDLPKKQFKQRISKPPPRTIGKQQNFDLSQ